MQWRQTKKDPSWVESVPVKSKPLTLTVSSSGSLSWMTFSKNFLKNDMIEAKSLQGENQKGDLDLSLSNVKHPKSHSPVTTWDARPASVCGSHTSGGALNSAASPPISVLRVILTCGGSANHRHIPAWWQSRGLVGWLLCTGRYCKRILRTSPINQISHWLYVSEEAVKYCLLWKRGNGLLSLA